MSTPPTISTSSEALTNLGDHRIVPAARAEPGGAEARYPGRQGGGRQSRRFTGGQAQIRKEQLAVPPRPALDYSLKGGELVGQSRRPWL
jgi:hypothetical protein